MKPLIAVAIILVAITYCNLVSGRPNVVEEKKEKNDEPRAPLNGKEKQREIEKLVNNLAPDFVKRNDEIKSNITAIMSSKLSNDEKQDELMKFFNTVGLDHLLKAWNLQLVGWYSKSIEEANESLETIFKPDSEMAKINKIVSVLIVSSYTLPTELMLFNTLIDRIATIKRKTQIVKDLVNENDPTLMEIENKIVDLYKHSKSFKDLNDSIKAYMKGCDEAKIHKLEVVSYVYYSNEFADDETLTIKIKEALKHFSV